MVTPQQKKKEEPQVDDLAQLQKKMRQEMEDTGKMADVLSGNATIDNKLSKKGKQPTNDNPSNLPKFLEFMEGNYKGSQLKVKLTKRL